MSDDDAMQELVATVARALVDRPDEVRVAEVASGRAAVLQLTVARDDIGKVIGKEGRTAQALRTVLHAACMKSGRRLQLDILD